MTTARPTGRFPPAQRIRKRSDFQRIQSQGRRVITPGFVLLLAVREPESEGGWPRLGITVTRKVGTAVVRNRAKRLVREAFRATRALWPTDLDLVVIVREASPEMSLGTVVDEWQKAQASVRRRAQEARKDQARRQSSLAQDG